MKKIPLLLIPLMLASCAHEVEINDSRDYKCGNQIISVDYLDDDSIILKMDAKTHVLMLDEDASGEKYENSSLGQVFWRKGSDYTLELKGDIFPVCKEIVK